MTLSARSIWLRSARSWPSSIREAGILTIPFCVVADLIPAVAGGRCAARFSAFGDADNVGAEEGRYRQILLVSDVDWTLLADCLAQPGAVVVEIGEADPPGGDWAAVEVPADGFYLSLTTATAFSLQVAPLIGQVLAARKVVGADRQSVVELCLQEAVANAIIHGNLGISSTAKDHPEGYRVFSQLVNSRLEDPALRECRVEVFARWNGQMLDIGIGDQGRGFNVARVPDEPVASGRSGRGFVFMRALASGVEVTDGGRCTSLRFEL